MSISSFYDKYGIAACETQWGKWYQTLEEVYIEVKVPEGIKASEVKCDIKPKNLSLKVKGESIISGALPYAVYADESTWTLEDKSLVVICIAKADAYSGAAWKSLLQDQYQVDKETFDKMEQKQTLEKMQTQNPGFDFRNASVSGNYHGGGPDMKA